MHSRKRLALVFLPLQLPKFKPTIVKYHQNIGDFEILDTNQETCHCTYTWCILYQSDQTTKQKENVKDLCILVDAQSVYIKIKKIRFTHFISGLTLSVRKNNYHYSGINRKKRKKKKKERKTFAIRINAVFRHLYQRKNIGLIS